MSEPRDQPGRTLGALEALLHERDRRMEERFEGQNQALKRAEKQLDAYKEASNEWRDTLNDLAGKLLTRVEWDNSHRLLIDRFETWSKSSDARFDTVNNRVAEIDKRLVVIEGRSGYVSLTLIISGMALLVALGAALHWHLG
jgi:hypothetical protein